MENFEKNKQSINSLNKLEFNPLISLKENFDWFIYDDESLNFLMNMENKQIEKLESIRYDEINKNIYLEDKYPKFKHRNIKNFCLTIVLSEDVNVPL